MVELDQFRYRISGYDKPMAQIKKSLDLDNKQKELKNWKQIWKRQVLG